MSEHLLTAKIPCWERVRKHRVNKISVFLEKQEVSEHLRCRIFRVNTIISKMGLLKKEQVYHCFFFFFFFFFLGGGGDYFSPGAGLLKQ